jgi:hypothetical protein
MERKLLHLELHCLGVLEICYWNQRMVPNSNSSLDVKTMKLDYLLNFDNINLCTCTKISMCILKCMHIIFDT